MDLMVVTPSSLGSLAGTAFAGSTGISGSAPAGDFAGTLGSAIAKINELQSSAEQKVTGLLAGDGQDIHTAALSVRRASAVPRACARHGCRDHQPAPHECSATHTPR